ncbi:hypothetical protein C8F01DRAFT_1121385 [Mycena amicta]|nr:hypothetical protein C8F01DRAFT_1121385 [Mycena amicta]
MELTRPQPGHLQPFTTSEIQVALRDALPLAVPGRLLHETYNAAGRFAERHANRAGHRLGLGPLAIVERIHSFFKTDREAKLEKIRSKLPHKLEKDCLRLTRYAFPEESFKTQIDAFRGIVTLSTLYPGLRVLFLSFVAPDTPPDPTEGFFRRLWARDDAFGQAEDFLFHLQFAASCLSDADISTIIEESSFDGLSRVEMQTETDGLCVIERLLVASDCENPFLTHLALRYLMGILECPSFWLPLSLEHTTSHVFDAVLRKVCIRATSALKDLGLGSNMPRREDEDDSAPSNDDDELALLKSDMEGVDYLCCSILRGSQKAGSIVCDASESPEWYEAFAELVKILRNPRAKRLVPDAWVLNEEIVLLQSRHRDQRMRYRLEPVETLVLPVSSEPPPVPQPRPLLVSRFRTAITNVSRMRQAYNARRREAIPQPLPASGTPSLMSLAEEESPSSADLDGQLQEDSEHHVGGGGEGGDSCTNSMALAEDAGVESALALASAVADGGDAGSGWTETESEGENGRDEGIEREEDNEWEDADNEEEEIDIRTRVESEGYAVETRGERASRGRPEPSTTFADFTEHSSSEREPMAVIPDEEPVIGWPWSHLNPYPRTGDDFSDDDDSSDEEDLYAASPRTFDESVEQSHPPSIAGSLSASRQPASDSLIVKLPSSAYKNAPQQAAVQLGGLSRLLRSNPPVPTSTSAIPMAAATGGIQDEETTSSSWETEGTLSSSWDMERDLYDYPPSYESREHYPSSSPRSIRRQMVREEMSESVRQGLFPQRYLARMDNGLSGRGLGWVGVGTARR